MVSNRIGGTILLNHRSGGALHRSQTRPVTAGGGRRPTSVFAEAAVAPGRAALALRARTAGQGLVGWVETPSPGSADGTHAFVSADSAHFALLCLLSASIFLAACTERKWFRYIDGPTLVLLCWPDSGRSGSLQFAPFVAMGAERPTQRTASRVCLDRVPPPSPWPGMGAGGSMPS